MVRIEPNWQVKMSGVIPLPMSARQAWDRLRDFTTFCCIDLFHKRVRMSAASPGPGIGLEIDHALLGVGLTRVGRILRWEEGRGYSFSDLSRRNRLAGFPHVYFFDLQEVDSETCGLTIRINGVWTATWLPRWMIRVWLGLLFFKILTSAERVLLKSLGAGSYGGDR